MKLKVLTGAVLLTFAINSGYADTPLLMEGKSSIYQRVLTTPSCRLKAKSDDKDGKVVDAFSRFYVYADDGKTLKVIIGIAYFAFYILYRYVLWIFFCLFVWHRQFVPPFQRAHKHPAKAYNLHHNAQCYGHCVKDCFDKNLNKR